MTRIGNFASRLYEYFIRYQLLEGGARFAWRMSGTTSPSGMRQRYHFDTGGRLVGKTGRDAFDQVFDFLCDQFRTLSMFFREEWCAHPRTEVYTVDDGDEDIGPCIQTVCGKCGGYILDSMIDRYA